MRLPLIKYGNIALTIITIPLQQYPLCRRSLVPLGGYIVNSLDCYSYRLIGKLTAFLQIQEFSLHNQPVDYSTSAARRSLRSLKQKSTAPSPRLQFYVLTLTLTGHLLFKNTYSPITLANLACINLVSIFRCSSPPCNLVYGRRVAPSAFAFSLS